MILPFLPNGLQVHNVLVFILYSYSYFLYFCASCVVMHQGFFPHSDLYYYEINYMHFHILISFFKLQGSTNLESVQIIKKPGGSLIDSFLDEG